jgi:hypothetical protein
MEYPANIVWACAAAAQRINNGYEQHSSTQQPNNKRLVYGFLEDYRSNKLELLADDYIEGDAVRQYWQYQTMALLDDRTNDYIRTVVKISHSDIIDNKGAVALIASCIQAKSRDEKQAEVKNIKLSLNSKIIYKVGDKPKFDKTNDIHIINSRYIDRVGASVVECVIDGNLYVWWSNRRLELGNYDYLHGRVKSLDVDKDSNQLVTRLFYVKANRYEKTLL